MHITVQSSACPLASKKTYALYEGNLPIIPATIFLRHLAVNADLDSDTLSAYAYALKTFFVFLLENHISFWSLKVANIKQFKRFYLNRRNGGGELDIKRQTAQQYLRAVKSLIHYWRGLKDEDPLFLDANAELDGVRRLQQGHGRLLHISWYSRAPSNLWRIKVPPKEKHGKLRYKGLLRELCLRVINALNHTKRDSDIRTMLYYRNRAIWTFLLMTGLRKGELCRIRLEDVNQPAGTVTLKDRTEDSWLGDLKSGPGEIFVTSQNPYWAYLDSWLLEGRWLAEERLKKRGVKDHGLLFTNRNGGPLTQAAVNHLFLQLKETCHLKKDVFLHPHITRHTTATLMLNNGVDMIEVQKFLRHRSISSTEIYARIADPDYRQAMETFWSRCGVLT